MEKMSFSIVIVMLPNVGFFVNGDFDGIASNAFFNIVQEIDCYSQGGNQYFINNITPKIYENTAKIGDFVGTRELFGKELTDALASTPEEYFDLPNAVYEGNTITIEDLKDEQWMIKMKTVEGWKFIDVLQNTTEGIVKIYENDDVSDD